MGDQAWRDESWRSGQDVPGKGPAHETATERNAGGNSPPPCQHALLTQVALLADLFAQGIDEFAWEVEINEMQLCKPFITPAKQRSPGTQDDKRSRAVSWRLASCQCGECDTNEHVSHIQRAPRRYLKVQSSALRASDFNPDCFESRCVAIALFLQFEIGACTVHLFKAHAAIASRAHNSLISFIASSVCTKWQTSSRVALNGAAMESWRPWLECLAIAAAFVLPLHRGKTVSRNNAHTISRRLASTAFVCGLAWLPLWTALKAHDDQVPTCQNMAAMNKLRMCLW